MWNRKRAARQVDGSGVFESTFLAAASLWLQAAAMARFQERVIREAGVFAAPHRHLGATAFWTSTLSMPVSMVLVADPAVVWPLNMVVAVSVGHALACQWAISSIIETKTGIELAKKHVYNFKSL